MSDTSKGDAIAASIHNAALRYWSDPSATLAEIYASVRQDLEPDTDEIDDGEIPPLTPEDLRTIMARTLDGIGA